MLFLHCFECCRRCAPADLEAGGDPWTQAMREKKERVTCCQTTDTLSLLLLNAQLLELRVQQMTDRQWPGDAQQAAGDCEQAAGNEG